MNSSCPLFSVITPMWNSAAFIGDAIESVLRQDFSSWEMIIADDGSSDGGAGAAIARSYAAKDARIRLIVLPKNGGSAAARNAGIRTARGRYLAFLDADDAWHKDYLSAMLARIRESKEEGAAVYFCGYRRMDAGLKNEVLPPYAFVGRLAYRALLRHCPIFPSAAIADTQRIGGAPLFDESLKALRDDYAYWLSLLKGGLAAVGFADILVDCRMHSGSVTASKLRMARPQWAVYRKALGLNVFSSSWYLFCWALNGIRKYKGRLGGKYPLSRPYTSTAHLALKRLLILGARSLFYARAPLA